MIISLPPNLGQILLTFLRLLAAGVIIAIAIFSTTYRLGGVLIYPRLMLALAGVLVVCTRRNLRSFVWPVVILLISAGSVALIASVLHQFWDDLQLFMSLLVRGIVIPYFAAIFIGWSIGLLRPRHRRDDHRVDSIAAVWVAILFQFSVTMLHVLDAAVREAFLSYLNLSDIWRNQADSGHFRFSGIGGISLYDTAISYSILAGLVLLDKREQLTRQSVALPAAGLASVIFLTVLHGRTGLLISLLLLVILILREIFLSISPVLMVSLRALGTMVTIFLLTTSVIDESLKELIFGFAGELIVNFEAGQGWRSDSTDDFLANHLRMPELSTLLFGSGEWAQPDVAEVHGRSFFTDSGYLLLLHFGGAVLPSAVIGSIILMIRNISGHFSPNPVILLRRTSFLMLTYIASIIIFVAIKGPIFMSEHCMTALFLVVAICAGEQCALPRRRRSQPARKYLRRRAVVVHG